jgi:hypothetical protein
MFGWTKREKNEKKLNQGRASMAKLSSKDRGKKLSGLRRRYPNRSTGMYDFVDDLFDMDLVILYLLLCDDVAVEEADLFDNPVEDVVEEEVEVAVTAEVVEEAVMEEAVEEVVETESFDSSTPTESTPDVSTPETTSFDSDTDTSDTSSYSSGSDSYDSGGSDSYDSGDSGDCGGD